MTKRRELRLLKKVKVRLKRFVGVTFLIRICNFPCSSMHPEYGGIPNKQTYIRSCVSITFWLHSSQGHTQEAMIRPRE